MCEHHAWFCSARLSERLQAKLVGGGPADDEPARPRVQDAQPGVPPVQLYPHERVPAARALDGHLRGDGCIEPPAQVSVEGARRGREGLCGRFAVLRTGVGEVAVSWWVPFACLSCVCCFGACCVGCVAWICDFGL